MTNNPRSVAVSPVVAVLRCAAEGMRKRALSSASALMLQRADAVEAEVSGPGLYWRATGGDDLDARYRAGVDNGLGGAAGKMAAAFDLSTCRAVAALLDRIAWMIGMDAGLAGRVGVDESVAIARAYLAGEVPGCQ